MTPLGRRSRPRVWHMGRQKQPPEKNRTNILRIRLLASERAELDKAAELLGLDTSTWARTRLLVVARKSRKRSSDRWP